jgi:hypothetical protein
VDPLVEIDHGDGLRLLGDRSPAISADYESVSVTEA